MPYYLVKIIVRDQLKGKKPYQSTVEDDERDVNRAYQKFHYKYSSRLGDRLLYFNCYQLARQSIEVMQYLNKKIKVEFDLDIPELGESDRPPNKSRKEYMDRNFGKKQ